MKETDCIPNNWPLYEMILTLTTACNLRIKSDSILVVYNLLLSLAIFQLILVRAVKVKDLSIITRNNFSFLANEFGRHQDSVKYTLHGGRKKTKKPKKC